MLDSSRMKSDRMAKRPRINLLRLSDITNTVSLRTKSNLEKTEMPSDHSVKEYIDHLIKENMALARLVEDKNKIIELTGTELHKSRVDLQKMQINLQKLQLQNLNLAQSNSHMLAELNRGKNKQKVQQHEIACKDALLKVKNEVLKKGDEAEVEQVPHCEAKVKKTRRGAMSKSMGPTTTAQRVAEKEVSENKRSKSKNNEGKKRKGGRGFRALCSLSPELQEFVGVSEMARTEVFKQLWGYIREKELQDPSNRRKIICDDKLHTLLKVKSTDMCQMAKALTKHIWPLGSEDGSIR